MLFIYKCIVAVVLTAATVVLAELLMKAVIKFILRLDKSNNV